MNVDAWPRFRRTLSLGAILAVGVAHVATRTLELAARHLLYEPPVDPAGS